MDCMRFYDMSNEIYSPILVVSIDYGVRPVVGDYIYDDGKKYKVIEVCIDYRNRSFDVFLEKIS